MTIKNLMIPMHLDALHLRQAQTVIGPHLKYDLLPHYKNRQSVNSDRSFLTGSIESQAFGDRNFHLHPGVHLHWALPDALTQALPFPLAEKKSFFLTFGLRVGQRIWKKLFPNAASADQIEARKARLENIDAEDGFNLPAITRLLSKQTFPTVPNRWMVTRSKKVAGRSKVDAQWLVESDYLHPSNEHLGKRSVSYPVLSKDGLPFRYMGRNLNIEAVDGSRTSSDEYLTSYGDRLTAIGYGEASFAAFYPNCHSIFGFHDPYFGDLNDVSYDVVGWYDNANDDRINTFTKEFLARPVLESEKSRPKELRLLEALSAELSWLPEITVEKADIIRAVPDRQLGELLWQHLIDLGWLKSLHKENGTSSNHLIINPLNDGTRRPLDVNFRNHEIDIERVFARSIKKQFPDNLLCYAKLDFEVDTVSESIEEEVSATISVANSGVEAASALIAEFCTTKKTRKEHEEKLEAVQLAHKIDELHHDVGPKFREARHDRGFNGVKSGAMWTIRLETQNDQQRGAESADASKQITLDAELAAQLNEVNILQQRYDTALVNLTLLRKQVFVDWNKYLATNLAREHVGQNYPVSSDEIRHKIDNTDLPNLQELIVKTGVAMINANPGSTDFAKLVAGDKASHASALVEGLNTLWTLIRRHNRELEQHLNDHISDTVSSRGMGKFTLKQIEGPRYWVAKEPSVVISGDGVAPTQRHGNDGRLRDDGLLRCPIKNYALNAPATTADLKTFATTTSEFVTSIYDEEMADRGHVDNFAFARWNRRPWHPFFMDWKAVYRPVNDVENPQFGAAYSHRYLDKSFRLSDHTPNFEAVDKGFPGLGMPSSLSGRTVLSDHVVPHLSSQLAARLMTHVRSAMMHKFHKSIDAPDQNINDDNFLSEAEKFNPWLGAELQELSSNLSGQLKRPKNGETNRTAHEIVEAWVAQNQRALLLWFVVGSAALQRYFKKRRKSAARMSADELEGFWTPNELEKFETWCRLEIKTQSKTLRAQLSSTESMTDTQLAKVQELQDTLKETHRANHVIPLMVSFWRLKTHNLLSQAISGFNHALLMKQLSHEIPIDDPLGFDDFQPFVSRVRDAVLDLKNERPLPSADFHPIRAGQMNIEALRLIDTFGQVRDLNIKKQITSSELKFGSLPDKIFLPPRITQPARLNFRWLSAEDDLQEMNVHPASSPVCGWVIPNHLDRSLLIYDASGRAQGSITDNPKNPWQPAPGNDAHTTIDNLPNIHLKRMVEEVVRHQVVGKGEYVANLLLTLESALENIDPASFAQHQARSLIMGRPLVLARASLDLQVLGMPATNKRWSNHKYDPNPPFGDTRAFDDVEFPVRIGEHKQLNDGLAGYWVESDSHDWNAFYSPQADEPSFDEAAIVTNNHHDDDGENPFYIRQSLSGKPHFINMLIDPRGVVHATSGILPTKAIHLPPEQYTQALENIEVTFLTAPLLTSIDEINVSLPDESGFSWSWLSRGDAGWEEISTEGHIRYDTFDAHFSKDPATTAHHSFEIWHQLIELGWLENDEKLDPSFGAIIVAPDQRKEKLPKEVQDIEPLIEHIFATAQIGQFDQEARFTGQQELREGWLKLKRTSEPNDKKDVQNVA